MPSASGNRGLPFPAPRQPRHFVISEKSLFGLVLVTSNASSRITPLLNIAEVFGSPHDAGQDRQTAISRARRFGKPQKPILNIATDDAPNGFPFEIGLYFLRKVNAAGTHGDGLPEPPAIMKRNFCHDLKRRVGIVLGVAKSGKPALQQGNGLRTEASRPHRRLFQKGSRRCSRRARDRISARRLHIEAETGEVAVMIL